MAGDSTSVSSRKYRDTKEDRTMGSWTGTRTQAAHARTKEQLMFNNKVIHPFFSIILVSDAFILYSAM